jgi:hypothetical protein
MSERHWPILVLATSALAVLAAAATVASCGGSADRAAAAGNGQADAARQAGMTVATQHNAYTAGRLRAALLTAVDGSGPAAAAEAGGYGTLPDVQTSRQTMTGVTVTPAWCAHATMTAFNSPAFSAAPAAVVTFRAGRDGVSEVLVAAPPQLAEAALGAMLPAGCGHYSATVDGQTYRYQAREVPLAGLAEQAQALNVRAAGYPDADVWSVVYRGSGFVGVITLVGPGASERGVTELARQAYARAGRVLSGV